MVGEPVASGFTVKEILTEIVIPDLKAIKTSLDQKADRSEVVALEVRTGHLEAEVPQFVKRSGPVIDTIRDSESRIDELEKESIRRAAIVDRYLKTEDQVRINTQALTTIHSDIRDAIQAALRNYESRAETEAAAKFSRRDKILLSFLGVIGALATIISTIFVVLSTLSGGGH